MSFSYRLTDHGRTLATARQGDLEAWLATAKRSYRTDAGIFVRWAKKQKLTQLDFPATRWSGPSAVIDTETRWRQARWLLHDDTLKPEDRVAGLLVLLYAQWPATLSCLTVDHVEQQDNQVRLRLGREPHRPARTPRRARPPGRRHPQRPRRPRPLRHLAVAVPGGQPGRPISAFRLAERLRHLDIHSGQARSTALFQLATDLPAAVLARVLGIHISVAVAWQRASAGD